MTKVYAHLELLIPLDAEDVDDVTPDNWQSLMKDDEPMKVAVHGVVEVDEDLEEAVDGLAEALATALMMDAEEHAEADLLASIPDDQIPHA